ncbi:MAG: glycine cleavage system protein GcvH [Acidobacteriota bacterium]
MYPEEYLYTEDHEWIHVEGEIATLGITQHAQSELGDIVFVELPEVDQEVEAGDSIGNIDSSKTSAEIFTPVSGVVVEVNESLDEAPEQVNESPHEAGWIAKIRLSAADELEALMSVEAYVEFAGDSD